MLRHPDRHYICPIALELRFYFNGKIVTNLIGGCELLVKTLHNCYRTKKAVSDYETALRYR
jgi:hypothetical protein